MSVLQQPDDDDDDDDRADTMSRSTTRKTVRGFVRDLRFNFGLMRTFDNSIAQSAVKAFRMWRGESVYIMPQKSAFHGRILRSKSAEG